MGEEVEKMRANTFLKRWLLPIILAVTVILFGIIGGACSDDSTLNSNSVIIIEDSAETTAETTAIFSEELTDATTATTEVASTTTRETTAEAEPTTVFEAETTEAQSEAEFVPVAEVEPQREGQDYVLNVNSYKFHYPSCSSVGRMKAENREDFYGTREEVINRGFDPCGNCHP